MAQKDRMEQLENALVRAHRTRSDIVPDGSWNRRVMSQLRGQERRWTGDGESMEAQRLVWRFAAAVCTLALVLAIYAIRTGITPEQLMVQFLFDDPMDTSVIRVLTL